MGALIEAGSDPLDVNKNNVISALDTISHYHCRRRAENHHGNQICDIFFNQVRNTTDGMDVDANPFVVDKTMLQVLQSHHEPLLLVKHMHEKQDD